MLEIAVEFQPCVGLAEIMSSHNSVPKLPRCRPQFPGSWSSCQYVQIPCIRPTPPISVEAGEKLLPLSPSYRGLSWDRHGPALKSSRLSVFVQLPETCLRFERAPALVTRESELADLIFLSPRYCQVMILSCFHQHSVICE